MKRNVIIIGGGASGIVAAIAAARQGASVTILEQKEQIGKKILSTGNGRCNFTNSYMEVSCFRSKHPEIIQPVIHAFGTNETLQFFSELGILPKERNGYYYPKSDQAAAVVDVLSMELQRLHVDVKCNTKVLEVYKKNQFFVKTSNGSYQGDAVILATGGKASPVLGSDGSGYVLAKSLGHHVTSIVPALVQLHGKGTFFKMVSGVRVDAKVSIYINDALVAADTGEVQLTNYGISGIPVFQVSRYVAYGLEDGKKTKAVLDFMPEYSTEELISFFRKRREHSSANVASDFLIGMINKKLCPILLRASGISMDTLVKELTNEQLHKLAEKCKTFSIELTKTNPFEQAQICAGGVITTEIDANTMESKFIDDLYIVGELLDVDGICGGYNLQWAWSTGFIAGKAAAMTTMKCKE